MNKKEVIATQSAPAAIGPYSQGIAFDDLVFVSGQLPIDVKTGTMPESYAAQTEQSLKNVQAILEEAGSSLDKALKVTVFLKDMSKFSEINEVYAKFFNENPPARCAVEVSELPKGASVEIEAIAHK